MCLHLLPTMQYLHMSKVDVYPSHCWMAISVCQNLFILSAKCHTLHLYMFIGDNMIYIQVDWFCKILNIWGYHIHINSWSLETVQTRCPISICWILSRLGRFCLFSRSRFVCLLPFCNEEFHFCNCGCCNLYVQKTIPILILYFLFLILTYQMSDIWDYWTN